MIKLTILLNEMLSEGGAGGHMDHPFAFVDTGAKLVDVFVKSVESLKLKSGSVKIDGVNASIRLVNGEFVFDRGTALPFDVQGMRPSDLAKRFEPGHGLIEYIGKVIRIFDDAIPSTQSELKNLGLLDNPNILFNIEYVEGQTNVVGYGDIGNLLAIHGLKEIKPKNFGKDGRVKSRESFEIPYDKTVMQSYIEKLSVVAMKRGFKVFGSVDTTLKSEPNLASVLTQPVTLYPTDEAVTKSLKEWLKTVKIKIPLITRENFIVASESKNIGADFAGQDIKKIINDTIVYIATIKLGDEILKNTTSEIGDLDKHEGIVIRDKNIYSGPFKITGKFILDGMNSKFKK
jgi:hypothetical protein